MKRLDLARTVVLALCGACAASRVAAQGPHVEFTWSAPASCPATDEVRAWVERLLGASLDSYADRVRSVHGEIKSASARRLRLRIATSSTNGTRERKLDSREDCQILAATAVVIIALSVDESLPERLAAPEEAAQDMVGVSPGATGDARAPSTAGNASASPSPSERALAAPASPEVAAWTPPPAGLVRPDPPETSRPWDPTVRYSAGLSGGVAVGQTPGAGFGAELTGAVSLDWLRFQAGAGLWPATSASVEGGGSVEVWLWTAHLAVGPSAPLTPGLQAQLLGGLELGRLRADPVGLRNPNGVGDPWTALRLAPGLVYTPGGMVSFGLLLHAVVPLERPRYRVPPQGLIFRPDPLVVRLNLGVELTFE